MLPKLAMLELAAVVLKFSMLHVGALWIMGALWIV
jgi:hypothetical protein